MATTCFAIFLSDNRRADTTEVAIIGAGPAGLMAAEVLSQAGVAVTVFDAMPSAGRKFLMAGKGGMNITHSEPFEAFLGRYGEQAAVLKAILHDFSPSKLIAWLNDLGIETFVGSSGRVFPKDMKAAPLLRAWLHRLRGQGVVMQMRHQWLGWHDQALAFATPGGPRLINARAVILALGGGSWPQLGSNAAWVEYLAPLGIELAELKPSNCGFEKAWSDFFRQRFAAHALKSVRLSFKNAQGQTWSQLGELMISEYGLEGSLIYAVSAPIRDEIERLGQARIVLDLLPDWPKDKIMARLSKPRGKQSWTTYLRKALGLDPLRIALLREVLSIEDLEQPSLLIEMLKALPLALTATRPLAEAISSAGGVGFAALNEKLMLKVLPGVFCAGEMLDWEAPTGGYLLSASFATGRAAGFGVLDWLNQPPKALLS